MGGCALIRELIAFGLMMATAQHAKYALTLKYGLHFGYEMVVLGRLYGAGIHFVVVCHWQNHWFVTVYDSGNPFNLSFRNYNYMAHAGDSSPRSFTMAKFNSRMPSRVSHKRLGRRQEDGYSRSSRRATLYQK